MALKADVDEVWLTYWHWTEHWEYTSTSTTMTSNYKLSSPHKSPVKFSIHEEDDAFDATPKASSKNTVSQQPQTHLMLGHIY